MFGKKPPRNARKRPVLNLQDANSATSGVVVARALRLHFGAAISDMEKPLTSRWDQQVEELKKALTAERDARQEDRFIFYVVAIILLDVVFFSVLDNLTGPLVLLILELLILGLLARRMGKKEIAQLMDRILSRVAGGINNNRDE